MVTQDVLCFFTNLLINVPTIDGNWMTGNKKHFTIFSNSTAVKRPDPDLHYSNYLLLMRQLVMTLISSSHTAKSYETYT